MTDLHGMYSFSHLLHLKQSKRMKLLWQQPKLLLEHPWTIHTNHPSAKESEEDELLPKIHVMTDLVRWETSCDNLGILIYKEVAASRKPRSRPASRSTSPHRPYSLSATKPTAVRHRPEPISRSRWQQIVMHAGSAAGTTAAVISEESMKCLRYCLYWLEVKHERRCWMMKFHMLTIIRLFSMQPNILSSRCNYFAISSYHLQLDLASQKRSQRLLRQTRPLRQSKRKSLIPSAK